MDAESSSPQQQTPTRMRRPWFPWVWTGTLAAICLLVGLRAEDLGVAYVVYKAAFAIGLIGLAVWVVRSSGWSAAVR